MKGFAYATLVWAALALIAGSSVVAFGLYNVSARTGHFPGVSWVLHTTYRNAVRLRAPDAGAVPDLSDPAMIALGARHYENACSSCHAAPGRPRDATALSMVPQPPHIAQAVKDWDANHLFWIVTNGVKMSGMPAWPASRRDDDVWPVVAFLEALEAVDAASYRRITQAASAGPAAGTGEALFAERCGICHGRDGRSERSGSVPRLDTLSAPYVAASMEAYRDGARQSGIMQQEASTLDDAQIADLAAYIGGLADGAPIPGPEPASGLVARGEALALGRSGQEDVPVCAACHGPGAADAAASPRFPALAGQKRDYLLQQLKLWKAGTRGGTDRAVLMHEMVPHLDEADMKALAAYYASLSAGPAG